MNISVCMATYNGDKYIKEQLESILIQLNEGDEVIVVDDCSTDNTIKIIQQINDSRIQIYFNKINQGHVFSFGKAIGLAKNDIIFMSDQDDIWLVDRVANMKKELIKENTLLVSSNANFINSKGDVLKRKFEGVQSTNSKKYFQNIIDIFIGKENYYGCLMAFKKELKEIILPIPSYVESHDLWIALAANLSKSNTHYDLITLSRRIHDENASIINRNIFLKFWARIIFIKSIFQLIFRIKNKTRIYE